MNVQCVGCRWTCGVNRCCLLIFCGSNRVPNSAKVWWGATPCCHTQLPPAMWPFGSAVRVLDTALRSRRSRRSARLTAHSALPPPPSPPQPAPRPHRKKRGGRPPASVIVNRGSPHRAQTISSQETGVSAAISPGGASTAHPLRPPAAPRRAVPRRAAPIRAGQVRSLSPPLEKQFIPWKLDELLESCEQVREES